MMAVHTIYEPRNSAAVPVDEAFNRTVLVLYEKSAGRYGVEGSSNPYALQPDTLGFLEELLDDCRPESILEFGCGESTGALAGWASENGARLFSVENDPSWIETMKSKTSAAKLAVTTLFHSPLTFRRWGVRLFFPYRDTSVIVKEISKSGLVLLDGPHFSGREDILYLILNECAPGTIIVVDDYNIYCIRDMLWGLTKSRLAHCFLGAKIDDNSHGLYLLKSIQRPASPVHPPASGLRATLQSYWRCWLDWHRYGTGATK